MERTYLNPSYTNSNAIEHKGDLISYTVYQLENGFYQVEYYCGTENNVRSKFRIEKAVDWKDPCAVLNAGVGVMKATVEGQVLINGKWVDTESLRKTKEES